MKKIVINGDNYIGKWNRTRLACRGVIIRDQKMLLSYDTKTDLYMIPGGGIEENETEKECCIREISEETGILIEPSEALLEIVEYYTDWKWVNHYFLGTVTGTTEMHLTETEIAMGTEPRWVPLPEALQIFADYETHADSFLMKRNIYYREYTALVHLGFYK